MQRRLLLYLLPMLIGAAGFAAQTRLSEEEFLAAVGPEHAASRALAGDLGAAEAERRRAGLVDDPVLGLEREDVEDEEEVVAAISWTPPLDGRRRWAIRVSEAGVEAERGVYDRRISRQRLELRRIYADWASGDSRASVLEDNTRTLVAVAERMLHRAEAGEESRLEAQRLSMAVETSRAALSRARAELAAVRRMATAWLSDGEGAGDTAGGAALPSLPRLPPLPEDLDVALRPDLRALRARLEQAEAAVGLSRQVFGFPELVLGWKTVEVADTELDGPVIGLNWEIPVFNRRKADRLAAENAQAATSADYEWTMQRAEGELAGALAAYEELRGAAVSAAGASEGLAEVALAATAAYEQGESSVTDLLETLGSVLDARLAALDLHVAALEAHRQLEFAAGRPLMTAGESAVGQSAGGEPAASQSAAGQAGQPAEDQPPAGQSGAGQSKVGQSKVGQSKVGQSKAVQSKAGQSTAALPSGGRS